MERRKVYKDVLKLALPAVGEMLLYMTIWILDTLMVGQYGGRVSLSAVSLGGELLYTFISIFVTMGIAVAMTSLISRKLGEGDLKSANEYANVGVYIGSGMTLVFFIVFNRFSGGLLEAAGARGQVLEEGSLYLSICSWAMLFTMGRHLLNAILRGEQNTRVPLYSSAIMMVTNLSLDYLLIFGIGIFPELGVRGAAIATVASGVAAFIYTLHYVQTKDGIRISLKYIHLVREKSIEMIRLALPASFQEASSSLSRLLVVFMIMRSGEVNFSANQIAVTTESLSFMPGWGFAVASTTMAGFKYGEKKYRELREVVRANLELSMMIMGGTAIIFLIFPERLVSLFIKSDEVEVIRLAALCIRIGAFEQLQLAVTMVLDGVLKGTGDTRTPFIISATSAWLIRVPLASLIFFVLKLPIYYMWYAQVVQWTIHAGVIYYVYRKRIAEIIEVEKGLEVEELIEDSR